MINRVLMAGPKNSDLSGPASARTLRLLPVRRADLSLILVIEFLIWLEAEPEPEKYPSGRIPVMVRPASRCVQYIV